eukprot:619903-Hanusia_phi.AAC.1
MADINQISLSEEEAPEKQAAKKRWVKAPVVIKPGIKFEHSMGLADCERTEIKNHDNKPVPPTSSEVSECAVSTAKLHYSIWLNGDLYINGMHKMDTFIDLERYHGTWLKDAGVKICECSGFAEGDGFNLNVAQIVIGKRASKITLLGCTNCSIVLGNRSEDVKVCAAAYLIEEDIIRHPD